MSSVRIYVPDLDTLSHGEARVFRFRRRARAVEGFVLRVDAALVAYANVCPHWSVDLDMGVGRFWDAESQRIFCMNHAALFDPKTGVCERGPCLGDALEPFELKPEGSGAWVTVPDAELDPVSDPHP